MRNLPLWTTACILTVALFQTGCDGCSTAIQQDLEKDAVQRAMHESSLTGTSPTTEHVNALKTIDVSGCPPDFRLAFVKYIHAWEEEAAVASAKEAQEKETGGAVAAELIARVFDLGTSPWSDHEQEAKKLQAYEQKADTDLKSTAQDLNDIAFKYGLTESNPQN